MSQETEDGAVTPDSPWRGIGRWLGREPAQIVTVLGLVLYASLRLDLFLFYSPFGVSPEEVGHSYASTLAQALVGIVGILLSLGFVLGLIAFLIAAAIAPTIIMFRKFGVTALGGLAALVAAVALLDSLTSIPTWVGADDPARGIFGIAFSFWWLLGHVFDDTDNPVTWKLVLAILRKVSLPAAVVVVVGVLFVLLPVTARLDARAVARGHALPSQFAGVLQLPWAANVAVVTWLGDERQDVLSNGDCLMYLGRSAGVVVLWDPRREELQRIPATNVAMSTPDASSCDDAESPSALQG